MTPEIDHMISIQATIVANALRQAARRGGTEADFRREVARILEDAGSKAGLTVILAGRILRCARPCRFRL